ncbi:response regulator [Paraglaciecola arctica]|uniref:Response regulator receiver protein n=1 Tax=Paraglaciecola arctica BSs20135 TaxID=493475 RepID=K6XFI9_9ALTE|nr:response regulator [Paraglaciecola arctica]GAC19399.1 response regulator receiver protein [Paraglaciecola arctica BSs20135]
MYDCNILVIDDDNIILELVQIILEEVTSGEIYVFSDSKQALDYVQSDSMDNISLVMCDWLMPDVSGLDILAALRKCKPHCPFLMLTANATKELVVDAMRLGVNDFVVKPFHTNDLITKVERLIRDAN